MSKAARIIVRIARDVVTMTSRFKGRTAGVGEPENRQLFHQVCAWEERSVSIRDALAGYFSSTVYVASRDENWHGSKPIPDRRGANEYGYPLILRAPNRPIERAIAKIRPYDKHRCAAEACGTQVNANARVPPTVNANIPFRIFMLSSFHLSICDLFSHSLRPSDRLSRH